MLHWSPSLAFFLSQGRTSRCNTVQSNLVRCGGLHYSTEQKEQDGKGCYGMVNIYDIVHSDRNTDSAAHCCALRNTV